MTGPPYTYIFETTSALHNMYLKYIHVQLHVQMSRLKSEEEKSCTLLFYFFFSISFYVGCLIIYDVSEEKRLSCLRCFASAFFQRLQSHMATSHSGNSYYRHYSFAFFVLTLIFQYVDLILCVCLCVCWRHLRAQLNRTAMGRSIEWNVKPR